jgi:serine/threonine protein kinase
MARQCDVTSSCQLSTSLSLTIDYAHEQGVIHGNLNPGSILLRRNGDTPGQIDDLVLTDFDFMRLLQNTSVTASPFYLSPEQIRGRPAEIWSDTYSLGVILYELCTDVLPFRGNRPIAIMMQHLNAQLLQPSALVVLNDLATKSQEAYTGQPDPVTGQPAGGALWIYGDLQRLASFEIRPFVAPAP